MCLITPVKLNEWKKGESRMFLMIKEEKEAGEADDGDSNEVYSQSPRTLKPKEKAEQRKKEEKLKDLQSNE